jgi:uncharacterized integral membrane protein
VSHSASGVPPERAAEERGPVDPATATGATEPAPPSAPAPGGQEVPRTRAGTAFKTLVAGAIVLVLLLVFILENTESVKISYFGASGHLPLGVALLIAAIGGALLVGIVGTTRILQLRRHVRRSH